MRHISNSSKFLFFFIFSLFFISTSFAATTDLTSRFLDKANEAFEEDNIEDAYKYINQALAVAKDEDSKASVIIFAQTVYKIKLQKLLEDYDDMAFIDIKNNLDKYPDLENTTIKKLVKQIEEPGPRKKSDNTDSSNDIDTYTMYVGLRISYLKINDIGYFQFNSDVSATILEILPVNENLCKVVISVPWNRAGSFQNYVIYIKKGDLLRTMTSRQVAIGIVNDFQYNQISFLGAAQ